MAFRGLSIRFDAPILGLRRLGRVIQAPEQDTHWIRACGIRGTKAVAQGAKGALQETVILPTRRGQFWRVKVFKAVIHHREQGF